MAGLLDQIASLLGTQGGGLLAQGAMNDPRLALMQQAQAAPRPQATGSKSVSGRPLYSDPSGGVYSEKTVTFPVDNRWYTFPSVDANGNVMSEDQVADFVRKNGPVDPMTGERFPDFASQQEAESYARQRSSSRLPGSGRAAAPQPASGGGMGGMLSNLFNPGASGRNQTVSWLQKQGMDEGTATLLAKDKQMLRSYLGNRIGGDKPIEINGRLVDPRTYQVLADFSDKGEDYQFITGRDGSIFRAQKNTGSLDQVYGGKPDLPTDVQEYEYAKGQGYQGSFQDFQIEQKRAGASQVNIDQKAEGAFDKKLAEKQAETFDAMSTEGLNAKADIAIIGELEALLASRGGTMSGLSGHLAKYGIGGEGVSDIQAAQALINKLVPTQRQPGSGTMSDRDVELFTRSLPSLWNTPEGNKKITNVMRGLAQYKQAQGEIADMVLTGEISRQEARRMLRELPNPLAEFSASQPSPANGPGILDELNRAAPVGNDSGAVIDYQDWLGGQ